MKKFLLLPAIAFSLFTFNSCKDWLDVEPLDSMLEKSMYSKEANINSVLNGLYVEFMSEDLYGGHMTMTTMDFLAHYYDYYHFDTDTEASTYSAFSTFNALAKFNYSAENVQPRLAAMWKKAYGLIFKINEFIDNMQRVEAGILPDARRNILLGEAYAMRAYVHFDLLRVFGPIDFSDASPEIPYSNAPGVKYLQKTSPTDFIKLVLDDLDVALDYLKNDPVVVHKERFDTPYVLYANMDETTPKDEIDDVYIVDMTPEKQFSIKYRNKRLNYYAVKALKARALLANKNYPEAISTAKDVISEATDQYNSAEKRAFAMTNYSAVSAISGIQDWFFYTETLFGVDNPDLLNKWRKLFEGTKKGSTYVFYKANIYGNIFGAALADVENFRTTDLRVAQFETSAFEKGDSGKENDYESLLSRKFSSRSKLYKDMQSLIHVSEMFYIMSEAYLNQSNTAKAIESLNELLQHRGYEILAPGGIPAPNVEYTLPATATSAEVWDALEREYYLEFVYEGQAFFFMKRNSRTNIIKGYKDGTSTMNVKNYVVTIPDSESKF